MRRHLAYLRAVVKHKWYVFIECLRMGLPLWTAIVHDVDKFFPDEWFPYARTFYAPDGSKQYKESVEFAHAWMLHQHRNSHHWQFWVRVSAINIWEFARDMDVLIWDRGDAQMIVERNSGSTTWRELRNLDEMLDAVKLVPTQMSDAARREMIADWRGAGRAYNENWTPLETRQWYEKNKDKMCLHPDTRTWVEATLLRLENEYKRDQHVRNLLGI